MTEINLILKSGSKHMNKLVAEEVDGKPPEEWQRIRAKCPQILQLSSLCFKDSESRVCQAKPMVRCVDGIQIEDLIREVIKKQWKLINPRIVVIILSNCGQIHNWKNKKQIKSFQKGLMKAAENTNMWLIGNGIDMGSTTIIGDGICNHRTEINYKKAIDSEKCFSKSSFIGIADEDSLKYLPTITKSQESTIMIGSEGQSRRKSQKYELNQNLTHYILIKDETSNKTGVNTFLQKFVSFLSVKSEQKEVSEELIDDDMCSIVTSEVPIVSILMKGGYECSRLVLKQIKNRLPIVVMKGTGGLADLLAFAYIEIRDRCMNVWNPEFVETYLKPELTIKIVETFTDLRNNSLLCNKFRNRILESIRESRRDGQNYLTVINLFDSYSCDLEKLPEYLLSALFLSQRSEHSDPVSEDMTAEEFDANHELLTEQSTALIRQDLTLCVDWNCPEVAKSQVLSKDPSFSLNTEKFLFEESLIRSNRWQFVDLFLSQKFKLRTFVSPKRLKRMFRAIHLENFFLTVCWESILGRTVDHRQRSHFLGRELNWLIQALTGIQGFVDEEELNLFVTQQYPNSQKEAERKALELIVFWAIMDFRKKLVQILWRHSDQPIQLALIIAMSYERISWYVSDEHLCDELKKESEKFVSYACDVLDAIYKDSAIRAEQVLNESTKDWNYRSAVDLAAFGKFKTFFIHPSCQRRLTNQIYGNIVVKDVRLGMLRMPSMFKLLLSAYLLFPMFWWIRVVNHQQMDPSISRQSRPEVGESDESDSDFSPQKDRKNRPNFRPKNISISKHQMKSSYDPMKTSDSITRPPFGTLVYETWTAPITKFWNFQFFYTFYLSIFSVAVLYPRCGNYYLDLVVSVWTALIMVDQIRQSYLIHLRNLRYSMKSRVFELCLQFLFLVYYIRGRIINWRFKSDAYSEKVVMCLALLHAYFVLFNVFLPISATLGPLLYRLKIMIFVDFLNFIRLSILVMISFGIVLQSILYPDLSINFELFRRTFHRAFFALFTNFIKELEVDTECEDNNRWFKSNRSELLDQECSASVYDNEECRVTGLWPYLFTISYLVLLKVILMTQLSAIFAASAVKLTSDTDSIWKAQRYGLVIDFVTRAPLPPPLNIFYYIYWILRKICDLCCDNSNKTNNDSNNMSKLLAEEDYKYLQILAAQVYDKRESQSELESLPTQHWERTKANSQDLESQRRSLRQLKGKVSEIERSIRQTLVCLESLKHLSTKRTGSDSLGQKRVHLLARHSPYPRTTVQRYPVPDKYVSWAVMWVDYDPIAYTKPKSELSQTLREFTDFDILAIQELHYEPISDHKTSSNLPVLEWNRVSVNGAGITINRQSWEYEDNQRLIYKLDNGIPVNPFGRTGLRGRGSLLRWGPNHYIMAVITRYKKFSMQVLVELFDTNTGSSVSLIERFISGDETYVGLESVFKTDSTLYKNWTKSETMIDYFKSLDDPTDGQQTNNLKYERIMKGYLDDPMNTDQAWKELELWHFHYVNQHLSLDHHIQDCLEWREVTENLFSALSLSHSKVLQDIIDKLDVGIH